MLTLGIETSCDETASAVTRSGSLLASVVSSSVHLHKPYSGIVPEIASRYHIEYINAVVKEALKKAKCRLEDIGLFAVTYGPGLAGSLLAGVSFAKALSYAFSKPLIGVNHVYAHLYANLIKGTSGELPKFPFIGLVISGGHTNIFLCKNIEDFKLLGNTQDDAVGEAFDKVAKIMDLDYPGGPVIEKRASGFKGKEAIKFPKTYLAKDSFDFSFSGIKTAVLYYLKDKNKTSSLISKVAYSFQESVFDVIVDKTISACLKFKIKKIVAGGGVAANKRFRQKIKEASSRIGIKVFIPDIKLCLDNGAMVAALGEALYKKGHFSKLDLTAVSNIDMRN